MFSKAPWAGNGPFGRFEFGSGHFGSGFPKQLALLWSGKLLTFNGKYMIWRP